jgi:hypothetical protein
MPRITRLADSAKLTPLKAEAQRLQCQVLIGMLRTRLMEARNVCLVTMNSWLYNDVIICCMCIYIMEIK